MTYNTANQTNNISFNMMEVLLRGVLLVAYVLTRWLFIVLRTVVYMATGPYWQARRYWSLPQCYHQSAHVETILTGYKFDVLMSSSQYRDFITVHDHFDSPEYVLKDNVSLYNVGEDMAVFVEAPEGVEIWRSKYGCFLKPTQFEYAKKVITMPLRSFHILAEKVNDPKGTLVFLQSTGRCGSTLLVRMFEDTGQCKVLCEPDVLNVLASCACSSTWDKKALHQITRNSVRFLCKGQSYPCYMVKLSPFATAGATVLKETFSDSVNLLMYRDCLKTSKSVLKTFEFQPLCQMGLLVNFISPRLTQRAVQAMGYTDADFTFTIVDKMHAAISAWWITMKTYIQLREQHFDMAAIRYEDLLDDPEYAFRAVLKHCGLPEEWVVKGLQAMESDSQENSILSRANVATKFADMTLKPRTRDLCNETLRKLGLPLLGQEAVFPGTITYKGQIHWPPYEDKKEDSSCSYK